MLSQDFLKEFTKKNQTLPINIIREYVQHLFLSNLYKFPESEKLLFKGGTALRIIYDSPRFSEDLDFSGENIALIENLFIAVLSELNKQGLEITFQEAKKTTGGYLGIIRYNLYGFLQDIKFEVSLRKKIPDRDIMTIVNNYGFSYLLVSLSKEQIVKEKVKALIFRKKPRDYYDLYFLLRHPELRVFVEKKELKKIMNDLEKIDFKKELSVLLPLNYHLILKDFEKNLFQEIKKYL